MKANASATLSRLQVLTLAVLCTLGPVSLDMYLPAMVDLARSLRIGASEATLTVSVFLAGISVGQVFAGPLSDRIGRRPMILGGLVVFVCGSAVAGLTESFAILLLARILQALGACGVLSSARAMVRDTCDSRQSARVLSQMVLMSGMAPVLAPMVGAWLSQIGSWRASFVAMAGLGMLMLPAAFAWLRESRSAETAENARTEPVLKTYRSLLGNRRLRWHLIAGGCNSAAFFTYMASAPTVLMESFGFGPVQYSYVFAANSLALLGAAHLNRRMLAKHDTDTMLGKSARNAAILGALLLVYAFVPSGGALPLLAVLFLVVGSASPVQTNTTAGGMAAERLRTGAAAALFSANGFAAGAIVSSISGAFHDGTPRTMCITIALCQFCFVAATARLRRTSAAATAD